MPGVAQYRTRGRRFSARVKVGEAAMFRSSGTWMEGCLPQDELIPNEIMLRRCIASELAQAVDDGLCKPAGSNVGVKLFA